MKKRALSLVLTITLMLSLCISLVPVSQAVSLSGKVEVHSGTDGTGNDMIKWSVWIPQEEYNAQLQRDGILIIEKAAASSSGKMPDYSLRTPPWRDNSTHRAIITEIVLDGITEVGARAFANFGNLERVVLTDGTNNTNVTNLVSIGDSAFLGCTNLTGFYRPNSGTNHSTMSMLTDIKNSAFYDNHSLQQLLLTDSIKSIGSNVFTGCSSLLSLWGGSPSYSTHTSGNNYGVDSSGVLMERGNTGNIRVIKAPVGLSGSYSGMTEVIMAGTAVWGSVVSIEPEAFAHLSNLITITIPASVTTIGHRAFAYNTSLEFAVFLGNRPTFLVDGGAEVFHALGSPNDFTIIVFPQATGWTTPLWNGYNSKVSDTVISLNRSTIVMAVNTTEEIHATVAPLSTASQSVIWTSANEAIATVAGTVANGNIGVIHGLSVGTTTITAEYHEGNMAFPQTCTVIVVPSLIPMTGLTLDRSSFTLIAGSNDPPNFPDTEAVINAIIYPSNAVPFPELVWTSSNSSVAYVDYIYSTQTSLHQGRIVPVSPGTATITVRATTPDGNTMWATAVVTVLADPSIPTSFVPVTSVTPVLVSAAMGMPVNLNQLFSVQPANATHNNPANIEWHVISGPGMVPGPTPPIFTIPMLAGSIQLEVMIPNGIADTQWQHQMNVHFAQRVTINIGGFVPVTDLIIDTPNQAYVGVPIPLLATVVPENATNKEVTWVIIDPEETGAYIDPLTEMLPTKMLITQRSGTVTLEATIANGSVLYDEDLDYLYIGDFPLPGSLRKRITITISDYDPNPLYLMSDLGGSVSGASVRQLAGGETVELTAVPSPGFAFAGWYSSNGGTFLDSTKPTTQFTMPDGETTIIAYFIHEGGITPPPLTGYFERGSTYVKNSGVPYSHTTQKTLDRFSHVILNGSRLVRHQHYTTGSSRDFTEIILANGYLDRLDTGIYTLEIHFTDHVHFRAQFTISAPYQAPFQAPGLFEDVYSSSWYYAHVAYVNDRSWMTPNDSEPWLFRPNDLVTQGEVVLALYRLAGHPSVVNQLGNPLYGLSAAHEWARQTGMTPIGGTFNLTRAITRQDVAHLVNRMVSGMHLRYPLTRPAPNFSDERQIAQAARTAVVNLYRAEIMNGRVGNTFAPQGNMTRAEYAAVLHRFAIVMGV